MHLNRTIKSATQRNCRAGTFRRKRLLLAMSWSALLLYPTIVVAQESTAASIGPPEGMRTAPAKKGQLRFLAPDTTYHRSAVVVANEDRQLVHTKQLTAQAGLTRPLNEKLIRDQIRTTIERVERIVDDAEGTARHSSSEHNSADIVKLNVYVRDATIIPMVVDELREVFSENCRPAVSFVETALVDDDAVVAMDAVAALRKSLELTGVRRLREPIPGGGSDYVPSAILPGGPIVYISGQAEKGELLEATQKTMESLHKTLAFLGLDSSHVVHIKAFVKPISRVNSIEQRDVQEVIAKFYEKDGLIPPMSFVEWTNASPIEIEMIAYGPKQPSAPAISSNVTYLTPPGMKASPVFSRVAVVEGGHRVYVSGLYGKPESSGGEQIRDIFTQLQGHLKSAGSDLAHMAKATYYVSNDDASKQLNLIRPNIYDPKRPPAASKAGVKGVGRPGCSITLDMIAATK